MINHIINQLGSTTSRIEKTNILLANKDNMLLQRVFNMALDPSINYYIKTIPPFTPSEFPVLNLNQALDGLQELSSRKKTGTAGIEHLQYLLSNTEPSSEIISLIIQRDLGCGVSEKTVNAVWKNLIPEFPCMLCSPFNQKLVNKLEWPVICETKMDGGRITVLHKDIPELYSRNGKPIDVLQDVVDQLSLLPTGYAYDGECLFVGDDGKYLDRKTSNGLYNKCIKATASVSEMERMRFVFWDMIPLSEFYSKGTTTFQERRQMLTSTLSEIQSQYYKQVDGKLISDMDSVIAFYDEKRAQGEEGIIIKDPRNVFEPKRVTNLIKLKAEHSIDVAITGLKEGTKKYAGLLGAIEVETGDGLIKCHVGSGFSDKQRAEFGPDLVGMIAEITYNDIITDKRTGEKSFFLPIFQSIRLDKSVADNAPT